MANDIITIEKLTRYHNKVKAELNKKSNANNINNGNDLSSIQQKECTAMARGSTALGFGNSTGIVERPTKGSGLVPTSYFFYILRSTNNDMVVTYDEDTFFDTFINAVYPVGTTPEAASFEFRYRSGSWVILKNGENPQPAKTLSEYGFTEVSGTFEEEDGFEVLCSAYSDVPVEKKLGSDFSFTEGFGNLANGIASHAEGRGNIASGENAHVEGCHTFARNKNAHAEGLTSYALGSNSHAEGYGCEATGSQSHAQGSSTKAIGDNSMSFGANTEAQGAVSMAGGSNSKALAFSTLAFGDAAIATGASSIALGKSAKADTTYSTAIGQGTQATGYAAIAIGFNAKATAGYSVALGYGTKTSSGSSCAVGKFNIGRSNTLFEVGKGTSDATTDRANAFEVYSDGHAEVSNVGFTGNSIITVNYFNTHYKITHLYDTGNGNSIAQSGNVVNGSGSATALGAANTASGYGAFTCGSNNKSENAQTFTAGAYNETDKQYSFVTGFHNNAKNTVFKAVFGKFNEDKNNTIFEVGIGEAATSSKPEQRTNAFEIYRDGGAKVKNTMSCGVLKIGNTTLTEAQLQALLKLLN